jgi:CelD/BcsL family acetyltransferase involved in cellulose biosynthesis
MRPPMSLTLERVDPDRRQWELMDALPDREIFQTREWVAFIAATKRAEPVVAAVLDDGAPVGYFTGLVARRYGVPVLGSPLPGWTTTYMGFNLRRDVSRREAVDALLRFAFKSLGCVHVELRDPAVDVEDVAGLRVEVNPKTTFEVDLEQDEEALFAGMTSACRRCIRKAEKEGVTVEEADDLGFADDYYAQLRDVFAKQALVPSYGVERVRELIETVHPSGRLLLLRARAPDGKCIATGIFPAMNRAMYFWGGASWRSDQVLRPNEAIMWYAMRYWRRRGIAVCDLGGGADYKRKYGPSEVARPFFRKSRFRAVSRARNLTKTAFKMRQRVLGRVS